MQAVGTNMHLRRTADATDTGGAAGEFRRQRDGFGEAEAVPSHDARELTGSGGVARVSLDGQVYTLRITRARKLILTK